MVPLLELYTNRLHSLGWNSEAVITSVSSSMLAGLMSTMLNDWSVISMCQRLMRRSSADKYVSWSELTEMVLSFVERRKCAGFFRLSHRILFIF